MPKDESPASRSVFAAFSPELFVSSQAWDRIQRILDSNRGGNYGLSGPRGAGKSWQIQRAVAYANDHDGLGVWFPSPSEYDPKAFLSALSEVVAQRYIDYILDLTGLKSETSWRLRHSPLIGITIFVFLIMMMALWVYVEPFLAILPLAVAFGFALWSGIRGTQ